MKLPDFTFPISSQAVFDKTVAGDWYDGLTFGITKSSQLGLAFRFDLLAWGPFQEKRVFAFSPMAIQVFDKLTVLFEDQATAKWPIWFPEWPTWRSGKNAQSTEINQLLAQAEAPQYAIASDSVFITLLAARKFDSASRQKLPQAFDTYPASDEFYYWNDFLDLPEL